MQPKEKALLAAEAAAEEKARDITILAMEELLNITDFFVLCSGNNPRQVQAIARGVREEVEEMDDSPARVEGMDVGSWILLDFGEIVVHVFDDSRREYYNLERLWGDAERVEFPRRLQAT